MSSKTFCSMTKEYVNELQTLGIKPNRINEFNDKDELECLIDNIKQVFYQEYKTSFLLFRDG